MTGNNVRCLVLFVIVLHLYHILAYFIEVIGNVYALTLATLRWLDDPKLARILVHHLFKSIKLPWQRKRQRNEIEKTRSMVHLLHSLDPLYKQVFPREFITLWELVDFLILL